ncbi:hypothetical protein Tco_0732605 [Tanacetum coccineum]
MMGLILVTWCPIVRVLNESRNVDPFRFTHNFIKKQTEEARKNNMSITHDQKEKGKKIEELDNDVSADDRLPIRRGYHNLDLNDPEVKARIEEKKRRVSAFLKEEKKRRRSIE